jgi:tRNA wybutosine-synthesizing protein 1
MLPDDLRDLAQDFRVSRDHFSGVRFAVFGLGDAQFGAAHYCTFAKDVAAHMKALGAQRLLPLMTTDEPDVTAKFQTFSHKLAAALARGDTVEERKEAQATAVQTKREQARDREEQEALERYADAKGAKKVKKAAAAPSTSGCCSANASAGGCGCCSTEAGAAAASGVCGCQEAAADAVNDDDEPASSASSGEDEEGEGDIEDAVAPGEEAKGRRTLLYPRLKRNLEKQGYGIIGSHSGVKLCRWTKSMLRGRGGCYKHTFYNISSFQCMEMTPSLACANKCVFCWRHHTNPVTRGFTWEHDPADFLVEQGIAQHQNMVRAMRGVPGVKADRYKEAMTVRHCALSLVGEPIIYPEISRFVHLLHEKRISSFMVTNAQFPEQMRALQPVTQLYVSVDAATPEELKAVDRPLFEDYWERFLACIRELSQKRQRTVFRLTLVQGFNVSHIKEYCDLVRLGNPDFIEVKGVTYCGTNNASELTMKNVPYHSQVVDFCRQMVAGLPGYSIACEHEHSCCMLLAKDTFKIDGRWHTWIDYDKFFELEASGRTDFTAMDYAAPTPDWAVFDSAEHGFDPLEQRHSRNKPVTSGC